MTLAQIVLLVLQIVQSIMRQIDSATLMKAGKDAEIAKVSASILGMTQAGKAILERVNAMSEGEVDTGLKGLEPK